MLGVQPGKVSEQAVAIKRHVSSTALGLVSAKRINFIISVMINDPSGNKITETEGCIL